MKDREFVYWLQGFFELAEPKEVTETQVLVIEQHLRLVLANTDDEIKIPFIFWLEGIIDSQLEGGWDNTRMNQIIARLQKVFKHIIDPSASDKLQQVFNNIHGPGAGGEKLRC